MGKFFRIFSVVFLSVSGYSAYSQGLITGSVVDSVSQQPVEYATISLIDNRTHKTITGGVSDNKGVFSVALTKTGTYTVLVEAIGFNSFQIHDLVFDKIKSRNLGQIRLNFKASKLKDVTVIGGQKLVENKIDKLVYNVANDLTAQGGVALDVLKKVPMVSVDIDGNVELQGDGNIRFLINGKPSSIFGASLTDALQSIPASQIQSIEVITSPGAKYDATGTGGIINIILKSSGLQGVNGSLSLAAGTRLENGSFNLNVRKNNFGFGVFFSGNEQLNTTTENTTNRLSYTDVKRDSVSQLYQQGSNPFTRNSYQTGINFNWTVSHKDELTASFGYSHFGNHGTGLTSQDQLNFLASTGDTIFDIMSVRNSASRLSVQSTDWSLGYKKTFKQEKRELDILYTSSYGINTANASQLTEYSNYNFPASGMMSNNPGTDHQTMISVDYSQPVSEKFTLETGVRMDFENLGSNVSTDTLLSDGSYVNNPGQTYGYIYQRNVYAAYISSSFSLFHEFLNGNAGLRYELTHTKADFAGTGIPDYNIFAPSFLVQHKLDESQSFKLSYSYRIERPDYPDLNPFYNISDPHNISTGNPFLQPEIGHKVELGYDKTFTNGNIYFAGYYRYNTEDIQSFTTFYPVLNVYGTDYINVSLTQRYNIGLQTNIGASIFGSMSVNSKLNLRSNIQLGELTNTIPGQTSVSGFVYRVNLNVSYQFANDLTAEAFGNYRSSQRTIQGTRPDFFFYNLALRKQFLHKKFSVGLTASNPFNLYVSQKTTTSGPNFDQSVLRLCRRY